MLPKESVKLEASAMPSELKDQTLSTPKKSLAVKTPSSTPK